MINNTHKIIIKNRITDDDYKQIKRLSDICLDHDTTNLKIELEFKMHIFKDESTSNDANEFFYYIGDILVGYLGVFSMGRMSTPELNGMVHYEYRRQSVFTKLFEAALKELKSREFNEILLLSDKASTAGIKFIESLGCEYAHSEYQMEQNKKTAKPTDSHITLRQADENDLKEIWEQDSIYFGTGEEYDPGKATQLDEKNVTYMVELDSKIIGKIRVEYGENTSIYGFGIRPEYRDQGYGKQALLHTLHKINERDIFAARLEVECKNAAALGLYKSCGFEEKSVMDYYRFEI